MNTIHKKISILVGLGLNLMINDGHGILNDALTNGSKPTFFQERFKRRSQLMPSNLKAEKPFTRVFVVFSIHSLVNSLIHSFIWSFIRLSKLNSYLVLLRVSNVLK